MPLDRPRCRNRSRNDLQTFLDNISKNKPWIPMDLEVMASLRSMKSVKIPKNLRKSPNLLELKSVECLEVYMNHWKTFLKYILKNWLPMWTEKKVMMNLVSKFWKKKHFSDFLEFCGTDYIFFESVNWFEIYSEP